MMNSTPIQTPPTAKQTWHYLLAAMLALAIVHALGRFSFTPLLPYLIDDGFLSIGQGADLASSNYVGYLLGALAAIFFSSAERLKPMLLISLVLNVCLTLLQSFTHDFTWLLVWRLFNGISNGLVFVLAPALVLEWLFLHNKVHLSGLVYWGVGGGLILSGLVVSGTAPFFVAEKRWLPIALLAIPMLGYSVYQLRKVTLPAAEQVTKTVHAPALWDKKSTPLFLHYAGAGLGYILPMTFLPTLAKELGATGHTAAEHAWLITAISCVIFTPIWNHIGHRFGDRVALLCSSILQGAGVLAVLLMPNALGVLWCAILVGCGFLGSVMCTQRLARRIQPMQGPKLSAALITIYAGAQLMAPWLAKVLMAHGMSLVQTFGVGFLAFVWSICFICLSPKA